MSTIIISEKNKAAQAIAEALGPTKVIIKTKKVKIYQVPSLNLTVIPLRGHILEYRNTEKFKSWTKPSPREIITNLDSIKKFPIRYSKIYIQIIKEYAKKAIHCIIGTDADTEGCNIGLIDALPFIKQSNKNIRVSQLWLSSLQKKEISSKFNSLINPKYSWAETAEARAIIDAFIGFSATREVTNTFKPLLQKFNVKFTSIGRVQTSLLYLLYLRDKDINEFVPESYFIIEANLIHQKSIIKAGHKNNPFIKERESQAKNIYEKIKNEKLAKIIKNERKVRYISPPSPLNTSKALILLTKTLKISADYAFRTMNSLYLNKIISYPRTDSDIYKSNFNHEPLFKKLQSHSEYGKYTKNLIKQNRFKPTIGNIDAGDHPPITPLESVEKSSSRFENDIQRKVYDILARHYLALFGKKASESIQTLLLDIKQEKFKARLVSLISEGFYEILPFLKRKYTDLIEIKDKTLEIKNIELNKKQTKPPPRYTDTSILKLMEKHRLGTKSTRPQIIKLLTNRKTIKRSRRYYFITELGSFIIENLVKIWLPFLKPEFTRYVEENLEDIKNQNRSMNQVIDEVRKNFLKLFDKFLENKEKISLEINNYEVKKANLKLNSNNEQLTSSMCIECNSKPMKFINLKNKRFLVCSDKECNRFLSLPRKGRLTLLNSNCLICGFNLFKVNLRKNNRNYNYFLCPACWNKGLKDKTGEGFCSNCSQYKIVNNKCIKR